MKKSAVIFVLFVVAAGMLFLGGSRWQTQPLARPAAVPPAEPFAAAAQPLQFIENRGQADARARYILRGSGQTVYLTDSGLLFDFIRFQDAVPPKSHAILEGRKARRLVLGLDLVGSAPHPQLAAAVPRAARFHYLIGNDRSKWVTNVPAYGEVLYRDVYPAVDMRVHDDRGNLRYDFIVRPGGRVGDIRLAVRGADRLRLDEGRLVADTDFGALAQSEPVVFQEGPAGREPVAGRFAYAGGREYGFAVGAYDASRPLVIDPAVMTLGYSTFLGGGGTDVAYDVKWDGVYYFIAGSTASADFPATAGAYDTSISGTDAFVAKIDPGASGAASLIWCTFIGGSGAESAHGIDVFGARAYIVGTTYSSDFPLVNAGSMTFNDGSDAFVCQIDGSGASLDHSVCVGAPAIDPGDRYDTGKDISVYMTHAIWICGSTTYGPSFYYNTDGSHREWGTMTSPNTAGDAYMLQVNFSDAASASPGGSMVFGGQNWDQADAIIEDGSRIYLTGYTESGNFPVSAGAFQSSHQGGRDAFVFKTDFGGSLTYSTFLGSGSDDMGTGIDIGAGGAYVCGYSWGDLPVTANGYDRVRNHGTGASGFLARVNESGGSLGYATYIETEYSGQNAYAYGIATGSLSSYDCWVTGTASSFMLGTLGEYSKNYYQQFQGGKDVFAARFDTLASGGDSCLFMTNLGGTAFGSDETGFAIDGHLGTAVVAGSSECNDFPVSASAYDSSHNGGADAFVATLIEPALAVTTDGATEYSSSAILHSTLFSKAGAASVLMRFEYGTASGALGSNTAWNGVSGSVPYHYSATITGLTPGTTYYYRAVVQSYYLYGTSYGAEKSFTTPALAGPTVTTTAASAVTATTASSGGNVTAMGSDPVTARGVCWSTSSDPTTADSHTSDGTGTGSFTSALTALSGGTLYHVRAYASNAAGTAYGGDVTFTTLQAPTVTTQAVTAITTTTATGHGNITSLGVPNPTAHGVCWNTTGTPTIAGSHSDNGAASATGAFTSGMTGLTAYTTYYVRAYATNSVGTAYGSEVSFMTSAIASTVTTQAVTAIDTTTATGHGNITSLGAPNPTAHGVCWSTTSNPTTAGSHSDNGAASATGAFTSAMTGLAAYTTYYVRAYATNAAGTVYGNEVSFTTQGILSVVTTQAVTAIDTTTATGHGNITSLGVPNPTAHGVCWNTTGTPTTAGSHSDNGAASATGAFTSGMTGLTPGTTYHVRAYATSSIRTQYGNEVTFTTLEPPTVTTQAVNSITATNATGHGNITSLGVPNPTAHGVCWNTTGTPTIAGSHSDNGAASATGAFTSAMTGLAAYTTYYVRAYATNAAGTAYGSEVEFATVPPAPVATAATAITAGGFTANWNASSGATGYRLDVALDSWFTSFVAGYNDLDVGNVTLRTVTGLASGTTYYYRVRAVNASGASADSNWIEVIAVPGDPLALAATAVTATGFMANWNAVTGAGDYYLDVALDSGFTVFVPGFHDRDIGLTSFPVTGLAPGTVYYYRVRAYNSSGISGYSNVIAALTLPPAPVALAATAITASAFQANWQAALAATGYRLDVSPSSTFATYVAGCQDLDVGNVLSHDVSGLAPGTTYYYRVQATNGAGSSGDSNVIQLTTLAVHTMRFTCTAGGSLAGQLTQTVDHGGDCTPVRADPAAGYRFVEWSGVGSSFHSIENPLTVRNVQKDMTLRATFTNAAPLVRIVAPDDGAMLWGSVAIRAEVSDDLAVSSVEFYVDGVEPVGGNPAAPVASSDVLLVDSGDLLADFRGADALLLDGQRRLRKTSFQGGWQPVIVGDFALRDVALVGTSKVHLIFAEPLRLADGVAYSWVCCDLETGKAAGIAGTPVSLPQAPGAPLVQFDAAGNGYYFAADATGVPALWQRPAAGGDGRARELTRGLRMLSGQHVRQWLALPDGGVLLELWRPETARSSRVRLLPGGGNAVRLEGGFGSVLGMADAPVAGATLFKVQGEKLLAAAGSALAVGDWAAMSWQSYSSGGIRAADMALSSDGGLFFIGSDPGDGLSALCSAGSGGCQRLVPLPQACRRLALLGAAPREQADEETRGGPAVGAGSVFSKDWNTLAYANGEHRLSVVARDAAGSAARDDITVTVANMGLALSAERFSDHAWLVRKEYARLRLTVENAAGAPVAKYVIYRRSGGGSAETAGEFLPSELHNGSCELVEPYAGSVTYWALALSAEGAVIGTSAEITI